MGFSDDQIIKSVDNIISAVEKLVGDIRVAPDIDNEAKDFALKKVGAVANDLNQINRALFFNDYEQISPELSETDAEARANIISEDEGSISETLSAWAQPIENATDGAVEAQNEDSSATPKKPRIIVSPVARKAAEKEEPAKREVGDTTESNEEKGGQDFSVASSFQESLISSLTQSETSLVGERQDLEGSPLFDEEVVNSETNQEGILPETGEAQELAVELNSEAEMDEEPKNNNDLTLINGIDQEVADLLATHGITSFLDIAEFKEADMLRLSEELSDPCRVSRENWIEQAALLSQDVLTRYAHQAQLDNEVEFFDRLVLNRSYSIHPEVDITSLDEAGAEPHVSSLTERLSVIEGQDANDADFSDTSFAEDVSDEAETLENIILSESGEENVTEALLDQDVLLDEVSDEVELTEAEELGEGLPEDAEFTDVLLAKKQALEAELAALKAQMVRQADIEPVSDVETVSETQAKFVDYQDAEIEDEAVSSPVIEVLTHEDGQNEISDVYSSNDDEEEEASNIGSSDDLGDGPIWHEEVSMGKDYVPPVVEDDFETKQDAQHFSTSDPSFAQREFHQGPVNQRPLYQGGVHQEPVNQEQFHQRAFQTEDVRDAQFTSQPEHEQFAEQGNPFSTPQDKFYTEPQEPHKHFQRDADYSTAQEFVNKSSIDDEAYSYSVDQLSEHAPTSHLDGMRDFPQQGVPINDVRQPGFLEVPLGDNSLQGQKFIGQEFGAFESQTRGLQGDYHASPEYAGNRERDLGQGFSAEFRKGQVPEVPTPPQANLPLREEGLQNSVEEIRTETSPLNQAEYMDDISVPRTSVQPDLAFSKAEGVEEVDQHIERHTHHVDAPLPTSHLPPVPEMVGVALGVNETVSDKVPDIKDKITNGQTLGQYLANKAQNEQGDGSNEEPGNSDVEIRDSDGQELEKNETELSSRIPAQSERLDELSQQDRSISLPPVPPHAPQINMADMRDTMVPPSGMPQPPAPPIASGIKVPPSFSGDHQAQFQDQRMESGLPPVNSEEQDKQRSLPPFPPQALQQGRPPHDLPPHAIPPRREVEPQPMRGDGVSLSNRGPIDRPIDGPTPPPFTDMPSPVSEGQAYADTQRIIAAKRRADAEKAMNRSDIPNGQAYVDTQQLMENGVSFEPQQNSNKSPLMNELPPLPPEAAKAASAYPKTPHSPEMSYRGQKPEPYKDENLPPLEEPLEQRKPAQPSGFTAKAKKFAESLGRSFVDKE